MIRACATLLATVGFAGLLLTADPVGAVAATGPGIKVIQRSVHGSSIDVTVEATGLAPGESLSTQGITATVDGLPAPLSVLPAAGRPLAQTVVFVIDTSGSMAGAPLAAAKAAALAFLAAVPADVRVGLVSFNGDVTVGAAPTVDRQRVSAALNTLTAQGETRLYDALSTAATVAGMSGARELLLLSDGGDTVSRRTLAATLATLTQSGDRLSAVGFRTADSQNAVLSRLAATTGGSVASVADAQSLLAAFRRQAATFVPSLTVVLPVPAGKAGSTVPVVLNVPSPAGTLTVSTTVPIPPAAAPAPPASAPTVFPRTHLGAGAFVAAGLIGVGVLGVFLLLLDGGQETVRRRRRVAEIERYQTASTAAAEPASLRTSAVGRGALTVVRDLVRSRGLDGRIRPLLDSAGSGLRVEEFVLLCGGFSLGGLIGLTVLTGQPLVGLLVGLPLGAYGPVGYTRLRGTRRRRDFTVALPDVLQMVVSALSAGFSFQQALDNIVRQGSGPLSEEMARALAQARLGIPLEDALDQVAVRMNSEDFGWAVMAVRVQREVGGNLADVLQTVTDTLRERERLRRQVRTLSAEGRLSAYILISLPLLMALYLFTSRRSYVRPLYTQSLGIAMLSAAVVLLLAGWLIMRRLVEVEM